MGFTARRTDRWRVHLDVADMMPVAHTFLLLRSGVATIYRRCCCHKHTHYHSFWFAAMQRHGGEKKSVNAFRPQCIEFAAVLDGAHPSSASLRNIPRSHIAIVLRPRSEAWNSCRINNNVSHCLQNCLREASTVAALTASQPHTLFRKLTQSCVCRCRSCRSCRSFRVAPRESSEHRSLVPPNLFGRPSTMTENL